LSVFNQAQQIQSILNEIATEVRKHPSYKYQVFFLNNGSTDNTVDKVAQHMAEEILPFEFFLIENDVILGPAQSTKRLFEVALSQPSDLIIKLDADLDTSISEVLSKFLDQFSKAKNPQLILTGLKTRPMEGKEEQSEKYRQVLIAQELRATSTSNYFFQDGVGPQAFPTKVLQKIINSDAVQSYGGRRGWDIFLPLQAKKLGYSLKTILLNQDRPRSAWVGQPGVKYEDELLQIVFKRIAASN